MTKHFSLPIIVGSAFALLFASGCTASPTDIWPSPEPTSDSQVLLVLRDNALRKAGSECTASYPYMFTHYGAKATFIAVDTQKVASEVILPQGVAIVSSSDPADDAGRYDTYCTFSIPATGLVAQTKYRLTISGEELLAQFSYDPQISIDGIPAIAIPSVVESSEDPGMPTTAVVPTPSVAPSQQPFNPTPAKVKAPVFTATTVAGKQVSSQELFAKKVTLLQFTASWCASCKQAQADFTQLAERYKEELNFVYAFGDAAGDTEKVAATVAKYLVPGVSVLDPKAEIFHKYAVLEPNAVAVIDSEGRIAKLFVGGADLETLAATVQSAK